MPRAIWKGSLAFGLVNIPVRLNSAVRAKEKISFRLLREEDRSQHQQGDDDVRRHRTDDIARYQKLPDAKVFH